MGLSGFSDRRRCHDRRDENPLFRNSLIFPPPLRGRRPEKKNDRAAKAITEGGWMPKEARLPSPGRKISLDIPFHRTAEGRKAGDSLWPRGQLEENFRAFSA